MRAVSHRDDESGMALITVFMVLMVASALMVGFFATIIADQRANGIDRDQTQAYAAAHAGLEKLTSSMATLFVTDYSPSKAQIDAIIAKPPAIPGFVYTAPGGVVGSGYSVTYKSDPTPGPNFGNPIPETATGTPITAGPYAGFKGIVTKYPITVTARSTGGAEVRLRRELQTVAVPVYQFGVFSETDLTFYAGQNFNFGGRVQTNGSLYLSQVAGATLTLSDRVTAFKEVVRSRLSNGLTVSSVGFTGNVAVLNSTAPTTRNLALTEGSVTGMPGVGQTTTVGPPSWTTISTGQSYYKSLLRNGATGAKYLSLPLVSQGALPIDLIKRPPMIPPDPTKAENLTNPLVFGQRYFSIGYPDNGPSLRILLSDTAEEIMNLPTIVQTTAPVRLTDTVGVVTAGRYGPADATHPPLALSAGAQTMTSAAIGNGANTITVNAPIPAFYLPPILTVNGVNVTCTQRSATQFLGCPAGLPNSIVGTPVTASIPSGAGTVQVSTTVSVAITNGNHDNGSFSVANTAAFGINSFWIDDAGVDMFVTCTGNDSATHFTGCTGISSAVNAGSLISTGARSAAGEPLLNGFIKIEMRNNATPSAWVDVTKEILNFGIAGPNLRGVLCGDPTPNAILRLQRLRDNNYPAGTACGSIAPSVNSQNANDYWPNMLYDTREGNFRDRTFAGMGLPAEKTLALGGMIGYIALDVGNLKKWLEHLAPYNAAPYDAPDGRTVNNQSASGYIVYFSDRRNNKCPLGSPSCPAATADVETGEYGFEDVVNTNIDGVPNAALDAGEDVNAITPVAPAVYVPVLDVYGGLPANVVAHNLPGGAIAPLNGVVTGGVGGAATSIPASTTTNMSVGIVNRPILFRRALKLINAANTAANASNLPSPGLSVASENPVYVQGNFNAVAPTNNNLPVWTELHMAAAILADAVTLLSSNWNDVNSFQFPNDKAGRPAQWTAYRFAVVSGKGLSFTFPPTTSNGTTGYFLFGTDGGVGNFLRLLEDWTPAAGSKQINYRGSIISLFTSRQAVGTFKCCERVYDYSLRNYIFDTDFLLPALLPPGTPMFRDVNTLTFRQLLRPNQ